MGRPERHNADYFPFYAKDGRTLFCLESKYGCKGTGFFTNVLRFLTLQDDHYFSIEDPSDALYFFSKMRCDEEDGLDMIKMMVKTGKLDSSLWRKKRILASEDLLKSLEDAYRKRTNDCITLEQIYKTFGLNSGNNQETGGRNKQNSGNKPQSKAKQSKLKKSKAARARAYKAADDLKKSKHFFQNTGAYFPDIEKAVKEILKLPHKVDAGPVNWWELIRDWTNARGHPKAMVGTLKTIIGNWMGIKNYQAYARQTFKLKNSKENARDCERESEKFKNELLNAPDEIKKMASGLFKSVD